LQPLGSIVTVQRHTGPPARIVKELDVILHFSIPHEVGRMEAPTMRVHGLRPRTQNISEQFHLLLIQLQIESQSVNQILEIASRKGIAIGAQLKRQTLQLPLNFAVKSHKLIEFRSFHLRTFHHHKAIIALFLKKVKENKNKQNQ
jgi:hypothetical protein